MNDLWCVRAESGIYTSHFLSGGYVAIGWTDLGDLTSIVSRSELHPLYSAAFPKDTSKLVVGQQVGQVARFRLDMKAGDYVITPAVDLEWLHYGVLDEKGYYWAAGDDGCPYRHRRPVSWSPEKLRRSDLSVPFQSSIRSSLTVFNIAHAEEFLTVIGKAPSTPKSTAPVYDSYQVVLGCLDIHLARARWIMAYR
jgi:restriction system protein